MPGQWYSSTAVVGTLSVGSSAAGWDFGTRVPFIAVSPSLLLGHDTSKFKRLVLRRHELSHDPHLCLHIGSPHLLKFENRIRGRTYYQVPSYTTQVAARAPTNSATNSVRSYSPAVQS